jgi:hypothetical protein
MWRHWLLWWQADADEVRRQVEGYDTLRGLFSARRLGFLLAAVAAAQTAYFAVATFSHGNASLFPAADFEAGAALSLAVLGGFMLRGSRVAIVGVLAVYTIQTVFAAAWVADASFLLISLLGWVVSMRVFTITLCVERSRKAVA